MPAAVEEKRSVVDFRNKSPNRLLHLHRYYYTSTDTTTPPPILLHHHRYYYTSTGTTTPPPVLLHLHRYYYTSTGTSVSDVGVCTGITQSKTFWVLLITLVTAPLPTLPPSSLLLSPYPHTCRRLNSAD